MDINSILVAGGSLGAMGLLFGAGLAYASQKFAVEVDPRVVAVREAVPGANCGGCGYPGCDGFAVAVVAGEAPITGCPVGGPDCVAQIAQIMGMEAGSADKQVARVLCNGSSDKCKNKFDYDGFTDCRGAMVTLGGPKTCTFGCMGLGTCERVCPFDAIHVNEETGLAVVDPEKCTACGICIEACPKNVIGYVPYSQFTIVDCMNVERGGHVKKNCGVACISCKMCERACPYDAIHVKDNLASIDYSKCTDCMMCVEKCPTKAITGDLSKRNLEAVVEPPPKPKPKPKPATKPAEGAAAKPAEKPAEQLVVETSDKLN